MTRSWSFLPCVANKRLKHSWRLIGRFKCNELCSLQHNTERITCGTACNTVYNWSSTPKSEWLPALSYEPINKPLTDRVKAEVWWHHGCLRDTHGARLSLVSSSLSSHPAIIRHEDVPSWRLEIFITVYNILPVFNPVICYKQFTMTFRKQFTRLQITNTLFASPHSRPTHCAILCVKG